MSEYRQLNAPTSANPPIVVGIGELLWDEFPEGRRIGGAPANFAYHSQTLGAHAFVVSAVGNDESGHAIRAELDGKLVDTAFIQTEDEHPTGSVSIELDAQGVAQYSIVENVAWDFIPSTTDQRELASKADAVCFGSLAQRSALSRASIRTFLKETRPDCLRVFDVNLRQSYYDTHLLEESLGFANILKLNEVELTVLCDLLGLDGDTSSALNELSNRFALQIIAVTRAENGCIIRTDAQTIYAKGVSVPHIADTVGAGDCFTASLSMGLLRKDPLALVAERANQLAAYVCSKRGAMPDMTHFNLKPEPNV